MADVHPRMATYALQAITPAPAGWRFIDWDGRTHIVDTVHMFGLGNTASTTDPPRIVSFTYAPQTGWFCCEERASFCGLLPPGWNLTRYEAEDPHGHVPGAPARYVDVDAMTPTLKKE